MLPFIGVLVPFAFHVQGLYRLRRGRSRVDDFFAVLVGSILAVVFGVVATLYFQAYYVPDEMKDRGAYEVSQLVWALFLVLNVLLTFASREVVRELLERRWRAGIGLKRILIAGAGELGRLVADKILEHRELGYQIVGFVDDRAGGDVLGHRGLPLLGTLDEAGEIAAREGVDHLYVALQADEYLAHAAAARGDRAGVHRRQGGPRSAAGDRAEGAARRPRRHPDHQHQRRPAAGLQQRPEAIDRHRAVRVALVIARDPVRASSPL